MNRIIDEAREAFRNSGAEYHQWEAFYMGYCAALNAEIQIPFPEPDPSWEEIESDIANRTFAGGEY